MRPGGPSQEIRNGHVCYTSRASDFYSTCAIKNPTKVDVARLNGTLVTKRSRNPIMGEKSPRLDSHSKWDFDPPSSEAKSSRYDCKLSNDSYPLIAKFETQKDRFEHDNKHREELISSVKGFNEKKNYEILKNLNEMQTQAVTTNRSDTSSLYAKSNQYETMSSMASGRSFQSSARESTARQTTDRFPETSRREQPVLSADALKTLTVTHPDIAANYRANRAAKYITENIIQHDNGGGNILPNSLQKAAETVRDKETARLKHKLQAIVEQLDSTNQQIERTQLSIGLKGGGSAGKEEKRATSNKNGSTHSRAEGSSLVVTSSAREYIANMK